MLKFGKASRKKYTKNLADMAYLQKVPKKRVRYEGDYDLGGLGIKHMPIEAKLNEKPRRSGAK